MQIIYIERNFLQNQFHVLRIASNVLVEAIRYLILIPATQRLCYYGKNLSASLVRILNKTANYLDVLFEAEHHASTVPAVLLWVLLGLSSGQIGPPLLYHFKQSTKAAGGAVYFVVYDSYLHAGT